MLLRDQGLVTLAFLWEKLSYPQFYKNLTKKSILWGALKFNNLGLALSIALKLYTSVVTGLKVKVWMFLGLISMVVEVENII